MSIFLSNGVGYDIASTYGPAVNMTGMSNAANAVATLAAAHGVVAGDIVEITTGWQRLQGRLARVSAVATNDVTLEGINTTNVTHFPAGMGAGSIRRITAWTELTNVQEAALSGFEQQFADVTGVSDVIEREMQTVLSAGRLTLTVFDNPALPWYTAVRAAAAAGGSLFGARIRLPHGPRLLLNGTWSFPEVLQIERNQPIRTTITMAAVGAPTRASA